jgi:hypothetical protein
MNQITREDWFELKFLRLAEAVEEFLACRDLGLIRVREEQLERLRRALAEAMK